MDEQSSDTVTQEVIDAIVAEQEKQMTPFGANIVNGRHVCGCPHTEKRDLGPLDGGGREHLNIYKCENHKTFMLYDRFGVAHG